MIYILYSRSTMEGFGSLKTLTDYLDLPNSEYQQVHKMLRGTDSIRYGGYQIRRINLTKSKRK